MPQPEKSFIRRAVESLALKLILVIAAFGGTAVLTWYTANSAWIHGIPGYKVGLIVAGLFALCSFGSYFLILSIARVPLRNAPAGSLLEPQESWLATVAERDKQELHSAVYITDCRVQESLTEENPHVVFWFYVWNGSVFAISIDPSIKGFIGLGDQPLSKDITTSSLPHNLQHAHGTSFQVRQELTARNVEEIKTMDSASRDQGYYDFGNLHITIKGNSPTMEALPARLQFKRVTRRFVNNGFELV